MGPAHSLRSSTANPLAAGGSSFGKAVRRKPTPRSAIDLRFLFPFGMGLLITIIGLLFRSGEVVGLAVPLMVYACVHLISSAGVPEPRLTVSRITSVTRTVEGESIHVRLTLVNRGGGMRQVLVTDTLPQGVRLVEGEDAYIGPLAAGEVKTLEYKARLSRGRHAFSGVMVRVWSGWGIGDRVFEIAHTSTVTARPRTETLEPIVIRPARTRAFAGPVKANLGGRGLDFFGCRAFTPGDDVRRINWRAFARQDTLMINEYELERIADVNVIVDARSRSHTQVGDESTFDHALRAGGSIASHFVDQGNNVGLLIYGDYLNWVFPGMGKSQKDRILDKLTAAHLADKPAFEELRSIPTRLFPAKSQIVLVSPLVGAEDVEVIGVLVDHGYSVLVVCPSALSLERTAVENDAATRTAERIAGLKHALFMETLSGIGARVVDWNVSEPFAHAVTRIHRAGMRRHR